MTVSRTKISPNGPEFSRIALGMWRLRQWNLSAKEQLDFIHQAVDLGITTVDHADIYQSEAQFGEAMSLAPSLRDRIEIITKCGIILREQPSLLSVSHYNTSRSHIIASLENSLRQLRTDYVDVLLIHRPDPLTNADEIAETFHALQHSGKVKHVGVSNFTPTQVDLLASRCSLVTNQIELSPLHLDPLHDGTLDQCQRLRMSPLIWSALAGGRIFNEQSPRAERVRSVLSALATEYQASVTSLVYAWLLQHPSHPVVLTGSGRLDALQQSVDAEQIHLSREHWFAIWTASKGEPVP